MKSNAAPSKYPLQNLDSEIQNAFQTGTSLADFNISDNRNIENAPISQLKVYQHAEYGNQVNPIQFKANNTGLPDTLKSGIEHLSGYSMDDVKVHYNSSKPAQLQAHAYAQGTDIHVASGQEKHLGHEAWHVVQQKQGRVQATKQLKGAVNINDDQGLEREADVMGEKASNLTNHSGNKSVQHVALNSHKPIQRVIIPIHLQNETNKQIQELKNGVRYLANRPDAGNEAKDVSNVQDNENIYLIGHGGVNLLGTFKSNELFDQYFTDLRPDYKGTIILVACDSGKEPWCCGSGLSTGLYNQLTTNQKQAKVWGAKQSVYTTRQGTNIVEKTGVFSNGFNKASYDTNESKISDFIGIAINKATGYGARKSQHISQAICDDIPSIDDDRKKIIAYKASVSASALSSSSSSSAAAAVMDEKKVDMAQSIESSTQKVKYFLAFCKSNLTIYLSNLLSESNGLLMGDPDATKTHGMGQAAPSAAAVKESEIYNYMLYILNHIFNGNMSQDAKNIIDKLRADLPNLQDAKEIDL